MWRTHPTIPSVIPELPSVIPGLPSLIPKLPGVIPKLMDVGEGREVRGERVPIAIGRGERVPIAIGRGERERIQRFIPIAIGIKDSKIQGFKDSRI